MTAHRRVAEVLVVEQRRVVVVDLHVARYKQVSDPVLRLHAAPAAPRTGHAGQEGAVLACQVAA